MEITWTLFLAINLVIFVLIRYGVSVTVFNKNIFDLGIFLYLNLIFRWVLIAAVAICNYILFKNYAYILQTLQNIQGIYYKYYFSRAVCSPLDCDTLMMMTGCVIVMKGVRTNRLFSLDITIFHVISKDINH